MERLALIELKASIGIIGLSAFLIFHPSAFAQANFNEADFKIADFGIMNGNPWLIVEGKAGGSIPQSANLTYAYAFVTDNGTFAVMSHLYEDTDEVENDTQWHAHRLILDDNNCIAEINDNGDAQVTDLVKVTNVIARNISSVFTAELNQNNVDSPNCVTKVFDSAP